MGLRNIQNTSFHSGLATFLCHFATFRNPINIIRSFRTYISRNKYHHLAEQNQYTTKTIVSMTKTVKKDTLAYFLSIYFFVIIN